MFRLLFVVSLIWAAAAQARDRTRTILVLDASGSMWGQIDGTAKITIAQDVIGGLLQTLPPEHELGLTVYGHRRKGDCSDIETLIVPGVGQRAEIADAVNAIKPKGKTPLSAAVIAAAEALRYTEDRATVILVSDGRETCDFDPCEVGRRLEAAGVDFTAHVIGFDVVDPADRAQLQCLAEETGGTFRTASNAGELADALLVVAEPPEPDPLDVTLRAIEGAGGPGITTGLHWLIADTTGVVLMDSSADTSPAMQLLPGTYSARVTRDVDGAETSRNFTVDADQKTVTLVLPKLPPKPRTVHFRATEGEGGRVIRDQLVWDILAEDGTPMLETELTDKGSIKLLPGTYTIEVLRPEDESVAEMTITVDASNQTTTLVLPEIVLLATVSGPESVVAGSVVQVEWTGPDEKSDFISVAPVGSADGKWTGYSYANKGTPLNLRMPPEAGAYELRYVLNRGREAIARQPVTVTPVTATLTPPAELPAGGTVAVEWTGPDYKNDLISVVKPGEEGWINYVYTRKGMPVALQMPGEPGDYEIIYMMDQKRTVIARVPVKVTGTEYMLSAPDTAASGGSLQVEWIGPNYKNDYIAIAEVGSEDGQYIHYSYTKKGSPARLPLPLEAGTYELRYVLAQDRLVTARIPIELTPVTGGVSGPETANAGSTIEVIWQGPDYKHDLISIAVPDHPAKQNLGYTYTKRGSPLMLQLPAEPGSYELRYVASGSDAMVLARQAITVNPVTATIEANASASPGSNLVVTWKGPDYHNDYLAISRADDPKGYEVYAYTKKGSPLILKVPDVPGEYELRYIMSQGRTILQRARLTVE